MASPVPKLDNRTHGASATINKLCHGEGAMSPSANSKFPSSAPGSLWDFGRAYLLMSLSYTSPTIIIVGQDGG